MEFALQENRKTSGNWQCAVCRPPSHVPISSESIEVSANDPDPLAFLSQFLGVSSSRS